MDIPVSLSSLKIDGLVLTDRHAASAFSCQDCSTSKLASTAEGRCEAGHIQGTHQKGIILYFFSWRDNTFLTSLLLDHFVPLKSSKKRQLFLLYTLPIIRSAQHGSLSEALDEVLALQRHSGTRGGRHS